MYCQSSEIQVNLVTIGRKMIYQLIMQLVDRKQFLSIIQKVLQEI
ncbi:unnamed protein product [Onchocerca flexuosa]|uniref:Uncharacterized protein n=1 Tax=Onchocerca flexuosa TaxID=387005 RepID=A0A183I7T6_9BILA|nr:unnamed protein product [Onchocerca flexuosa]